MHSRYSTAGGWRLFEQDYDTTSASTNIARSIDYVQNGCTTCGEPPDQSDVNGKTFCVTPSNVPEACTNFATDGRIESVESNVGPATFGVMTQVYPITSGISLTWDCPGSYSGGVQAQCSPSSTYNGGYGFSNRVSATVSSSTSFETVVDHHIMKSLTDTTFSSKQLIAAKWTGAEACGSLSCSVYFEYRGTGTAVMPSFTTSLGRGLPHQYIITGVRLKPERPSRRLSMSCRIGAAAEIAEESADHLSERSVISTRRRSPPNS